MRRASFLGLAVLALAAWTRGEVSLVEGRLSADALIWANCCWQQTEQAGFTESRFDFYRRAAFIGLTGHISSVTSMRLYFDVGSVSAYDLYVGFHWPSGVGLLVGQFKPPLGFEALTKPYELKFIEYSLVKNYWKPWNPRDVGAMLSYQTSLFELAGAVANGNGINQGYQDDNDWKDVAGRVVLKPFEKFGLLLGIRGYYGRIGPDEDRFENVATELLLDREGFRIVAEAQHSFWIHPRNSFYVQATYDLGLIEPVGRLHMASHWDDKYELGLTGGLNFRILGDQLKVMLDYDYWRKVWAADKGTEQKILLQIQATV